MKDFDFDELDKAVNSLLETEDDEKTTTQTAAANPASAELTALAVTAPVAPPSVDTPSSSVPTEPAPAADLPDPRPAHDDVESDSAPAAGFVHPHGRFMDVIHPSSDMTTPENEDAVKEGKVGDDNEASQPEVSRRAPVVEPSASFETEYKKQEATEKAAADKQDKAEAEPDEAASLPDPIDFSPKPAISIPPLASDAPTEAESKPLASPFLDNAEVEKRPLGAHSDDTASQSEPASPAAEAEKSADTPEIEAEDKPDESDKLASDETTGSDLPAELQKDILAVESGHSPEDEAVADTVDEPAKPPVETTEQADQDKATISKLEPVAEPDETKEAEPTDSPTIPVTASIPQQYREKQPAEKSAPANMYDVAASVAPKVEAPVVEKTKSHGVFAAILWIILALAAGIGGGAAAYFYVLPLFK